MAKYNRAEMRKEIGNRSEESYRKKDGGGFSKYFKTDKDYPIWSASVTKEDPHMLDIVPFQVGDNYPVLDDKGTKLKKGSWAYYLDIYIHPSVGPNNAQYVCPAKNFGLPCPICEGVATLLKDGTEWAEISETLKRRNVYNVICYDSEKEEQKGVQIFEVSHHYMEKKLQQIAKRPRGGGTVTFADPDEGKIISFSVASDDMKTIEGHQFLDRMVGDKTYVLSDEDLAGAYCLDEIIEVLSYEELFTIYYQKPVEKSTDLDTEKQESGPSSGRRGRFAQENKEEDVPLAPGTKCPKGHIFGVEIDKYDDCTRCLDDEYNECAKEKQKIEEQKETATEPAQTRSRRGRG